MVRLKVRDRRKAVGLKGKDLARLIGKSPQTITRIEHGADNVLMRDLIRIAEALQCSIHDLIDEVVTRPGQTCRGADRRRRKRIA